MLNPATKLLFLSCLLVAGESTSSQIKVSHDSLCFQSGVKSGSLQSQLDLLQSLQLLSYEKNEVLIKLNKSKLNKSKEKEIKVISTEVKKYDEFDKSPGLEKQGKLFSSQLNKVQHRGCIDEFKNDPTCNERLATVTQKAQKSWLVAYPNAEWICFEIRKAHAWCETNSHKAPKDFGKFMNNWLNRSFEEYRKGLQSKHRTHTQKNSDALQEMREKIDRGEL